MLQHGIVASTLPVQSGLVTLGAFSLSTFIVLERDITWDAENNRV